MTKNEPITAPIVDAPPITVDLLVIGAGGGGLTAALTAAAAGKKVLLVEKMSTLGGTTATSGGAVWIPNSPVMQAAGEADSFDAALNYLDSIIGDCGPATSMARKKAFISEGSKMVSLLGTQGLQLQFCGFPDYYSGRPNGRARGRAFESAVVDGKTLGNDYLRINPRALFPALAMVIAESAAFTNAMRGWGNAKVAMIAVGRTIGGTLRGKALLTMGTGLVAQLVHAARKRGVEILTQTPLVKLVTGANGAVTGAVVRRVDGSFQRIDARDGVVLATGGFSHNRQMRAEYQPYLGDGWTAAARGDEGDGIRAGLELGATVAQMDESWWMPMNVAPGGQRMLCIIERAKPHSIVVDAGGERFFREPAPYMEAGQCILRRQKEKGGAIPCWLVFDSRHRKRYPFGEWPAGITPQKAIDAGFIIRADSLAQLAERCGIDANGLARTVVRFNGMCAAGIDEDFHRGKDPFEKFCGDNSVTPNPTMGTLEKPPYYAVAIYPGDIGTNGGLLTDEFARVLRADGQPIAGLYATGNCTASVMGRTYPGPGITIAAAMVFGYVAANHAVGRGVGK